MSDNKNVIGLPACGHRGKRRQDGHYRCASPKLLPRNGYRSYEYCAGCQYHDNGPLHESRAPLQQGKAPVRLRRQPAATVPQGGPGTELTALIASLGLKASPGCPCKNVARMMDTYGVAWSRENQARIVALLRDSRAKMKTHETLKAAVLSVATGMAFQFDHTDPAPWLFEEALRRAEAKGFR